MVRVRDAGNGRRVDHRGPAIAARRPAVVAVLLVLFAAVLTALAPAVAAQGPHPTHHIPSVPADLLTRPVPLRPNIGAAHDAVSTPTPQAQAYYDQGLSYLHAYEWIEAARSLNQALRLDPSLAIAQAGLSVAYTELNNPAAARAALDRATSLAPSASAHDRTHIEARALQAAAEAAPGDAARLAAYRAALDAAVAKFPDDVELWLLRGVAESPDPADRGQGSVASSVPYYEKALAIASSTGRVGPSFSSGAHHYLTHAYENTGRVKEALTHAAAYAKAASGVPHAIHMHGHVLRRLGRIADAVAAFETADRLEAEYIKAEKLEPGFAWHYEHNLDLLASSYQYLGQMRKAEPLLKKAFDTPSALAVQMFNKRAWPAYLVSRGRIDEALAAAGVLIGNSSGFVKAAGYIEAAHAHLAAKRFREAADAANAALKELRASPGAAAVAGPAFEALQGEFFLRTSDRAKGRAMLQEAVRKARAAPGPDNWVQALFLLDSVARAARESGDWELATWAARQMIDHDSNYAGSHYALALAAEHAGDTAAARAAFTAAAKLWAGADPDLAELETVRARLGAAPAANGTNGK